MSKLNELIAKLCPHGVEFKRLGDIAEYGTGRIDAADVDLNSYVGVDNLLPYKQGKTISSYVPTEGRLILFTAGDILIGNIRPYLKKIWFAEYKIPVPPLEVQREIVRILDAFTELTAELTARKKQYEYYRDQLLTFDHAEF